MPTPVLSPLPATPVAPAIARQAGLACCSGRDRLSYPPLPWPLEDLVGTSWRNLFTGAPGTVIRLQDVPIARRMRPQPIMAVLYGQRAWADSLGLWWGPSFVIEHWVRVDHWPPPDQLSWFGVELGHYRGDIAHLEHQLAFLLEHWETCSCPVENRNLLRQDVQSARKSVEGVLARMRQFAGRFRLEVSPDLLNSGLERMRQPTQLSLL
jgi:hypothetical protein